MPDLVLVVLALCAGFTVCMVVHGLTYLAHRWWVRR
jgi:hypothetical protein